MLIISLASQSCRVRLQQLESFYEGVTVAYSGFSGSSVMPGSFPVLHHEDLATCDFPVLQEPEGECATGEGCPPWRGVSSMMMR